MFRVRLLIVRWPLMALVLLCLLMSPSLSGCGGSKRATPTPTKTPKTTVLVEAATATPRPPTATPTPTPTPVPPTPTPIPPTPTPTNTPTPTPDLYARPENVNPLTGLPVDDPTKLQRRPICVVINNSPVARPQYGLAEAEIVYEYIMEGRAVTRFTAIYLVGEAERIGPVRSARLINYVLSPQYDCALAASGGNDHTRWLLKHKADFPYLDIDLDDPGNNVYSYSIGKHWETRLQTNSALLRKWLKNWEVEKVPHLRGFAFDPQPPTGASGQSVHIPYSKNSAVDWTYDAAKGHYLRAVAGQPHLDAATQTRLSAANVIIQTVEHLPTEWVEDSLGNTSIDMVMVGEGKALVLRDGVLIEGFWRALDPHQMPEFRDASGQIIPLKPGNTWIEVVEPTLTVTVK